MRRAHARQCRRRRACRAPRRRRAQRASRVRANGKSRPSRNRWRQKRLSSMVFGTSNTARLARCARRTDRAPVELSAAASSSDPHQACPHPMSTIEAKEAWHTLAASRASPSNSGGSGRAARAASNGRAVPRLPRAVWSRFMIDRCGLSSSNWRLADVLRHTARYCGLCVQP